MTTLDDKIWNYANAIEKIGNEENLEYEESIDLLEQILNLLKYDSAQIATLIMQSYGNNIEKTKNKLKQLAQFLINERNKEEWNLIIQEAFFKIEERDDLIKKIKILKTEFQKAGIDISTFIKKLEEIKLIIEASEKTEIEWINLFYNKKAKKLEELTSFVTGYSLAIKNFFTSIYLKNLSSDFKILINDIFPELNNKGIKLPPKFNDLIVESEDLLKISMKDLEIKNIEESVINFLFFYMNVEKIKSKIKEFKKEKNSSWKSNDFNNIENLIINSFNACKNFKKFNKKDINEFIKNEKNKIKSELNNLYNVVDSGYVKNTLNGIINGSTDTLDKQILRFVCYFNEFNIRILTTDSFLADSIVLLSQILNYNKFNKNTNIKNLDKEHTVENFVDGNFIVVYDTGFFVKKKKLDFKKKW